MNRVYKHYAINVAASGQEVVPATKVMSFSSYPGYLSSLDDFLIMDRYIMHGTHIIFETFQVIFALHYYYKYTRQLFMLKCSNWIVKRVNN